MAPPPQQWLVVTSLRIEDLGLVISLVASPLAETVDAADVVVPFFQDFWTRAIERGQEPPVALHANP